MRFLDGLRPGHHRRKVDQLAMVFRLVHAPNRLHCLELLAHFLETGLVDRTVVFHLLGLPPATDTEDKASSGNLVKRGDELCSLDGVALNHEAETRREPEPRGPGRR